MLKTQTDTLQGGLTLVRHYDDAYNLDQQCGALSYYQQLAVQFRDQALEYYDRTPGGLNKFLEKVTIHVYSGLVQMPIGAQFETYCQGTTIHTRYLDPAQDSYRFPAALSHEFGHAYRGWTRAFDADRPYGLQLRQLFERQFSSNHSTFSGTAAPWDQPWGAGSRDEDAEEQFANAYRFSFGALCTRGSSGSGTKDPVVPGFENPAQHPEWAKQIRLLPELTAYLDAFGLLGPSLSWQGGADGYWQFQRGDGTWMAQLGYYTWFEWTGTAWRAASPTYNRF